MEQNPGKNASSAVNQQERLNEMQQIVAQLQEEYDTLQDNLEQKSKRGEEITEEERQELSRLHGELIDCSNSLHGIESQIEIEKRRL
jgi:predicted nuclease with TOPRIM domain